MNYMNDGTYTFFSPGDKVTVKHDIPNKPIMWMVEKQSKTIKNKNTDDYETMFLGIKCRWFDTTGRLQEAVFNTKDIIKVE